MLCISPEKENHTFQNMTTFISALIILSLYLSLFFCMSVYLFELVNHLIRIEPAPIHWFTPQMPVTDSLLLASWSWEPGAWSWSGYGGERLEDKNLLPYRVLTRRKLESKVELRHRPRYTFLWALTQMVSSQSEGVNLHASCSVF